MVILEGPGGTTVAWEPGQIAGLHGGSEVDRAEPIKLRAGDRVRWTRNDKGLRHHTQNRNGGRRLRPLLSIRHGATQSSASQRTPDTAQMRLRPVLC